MGAVERELFREYVTKGKSRSYGVDGKRPPPVGLSGDPGVVHHDVQASKLGPCFAEKI